MKQFIITFFLLIGLCNMATAITYEKMPEYPGGERQWKKVKVEYNLPFILRLQ